MDLSEPKPRLLYVIEFYHADRGWIPTTEQAVTTSYAEAEGQLRKIKSHYEGMNLEVNWKITPYGEVRIDDKADVLGPHGCFANNPPAGVP